MFHLSQLSHTAEGNGGVEVNYGFAISLPAGPRRSSICPVSFTEIIEELPKLSADQRAALLRRLKELEEKDELLFLHESADSMFQELDKQEEKDARRKTR